MIKSSNQSQNNEVEEEFAEHENPRKYQRPDLVMVNRAAKTVQIVDVTTATPSNHCPDALEKARQVRIKRYTPLAKAFEKAGYEVIQNDAYVIGTNGAYKSTNDKVLEKLGISKSWASKMNNYMVGDVLRFGGEIFQRFMNKAESIQS